MFAKRLQWFVILMVAIAAITVARLVDIQVLRAERFEAIADRMLTRPISYLTAPRGGVRDRNGQLLLSDEPASDISVRYEMLVALTSDEPPESAVTYLRAVARTLRGRGVFPADMPTGEIVVKLEARVDAMWRRLAELSGLPPDDLTERAGSIRDRVQRVKGFVQRRSPTVREIAEERGFHALIPAVDEELALEVRLELETQCPWLRVVPSSRRVAHDADALVHVLGRLGAASPRRIEDDPLRDDELRGLRAGDRCGISGVERVAELALRGERGRVIEDFDRNELERVDPVHGGDVSLTIDADLQRSVLDILKSAVDKSENPCGGSVVVIDVETRELLALVSYPTYGYDDYSRRYDEMVRDNRWQPTRFRAVANMYPPGSTCKVIGLYGALVEGVVTENSTITCNGMFRPERPNRFRCWYYNQYSLTHGPQTASEAIRNSCNIYFYTVGDRLGVDRLCHWFSEFGLGRLQGTHLIEETAGIVPNSEWIRSRRGGDPHVRPADAWNFSIGQGEVSGTPLQSANVAATVASGRWAPVKLIRDDAGQFAETDAAPPVEFDTRYLRVLREGMWRVVNERGATAFRHARIESDDYVLCGKTGSAQAAARALKRRWYLKWPDGRRETVIGGLIKEDLLARYPDEKPEITGYRTCERFPALSVDDKLPSHAWFIGYTQRKDTPPGQRPRGKVYAISAIVEYGGSGGGTAGPVVKKIAEMLVRQ